MVGQTITLIEPYPVYAPCGEFFFTQHKEAIDKLNILSTLRTLKYLLLVATRRVRIETAALADDTHVLDIVCLVCDVLPCLFLFLIFLLLSYMISDDRFYPDIQVSSNVVSNPDLVLFCHRYPLSSPCPSPAPLT